ncbi:hypothetical protein MMC07_009501, partial [Pseudocyphellaria aurata]|nr:hypothetical protein [Pseudocyphellaria aurata]
LGVLGDELDRILRAARGKGLSETDKEGDEEGDEESGKKDEVMGDGDKVESDRHEEEE